MLEFFHFQSSSILNLENLGFLVRFLSLPRKDRTKYLWLVSFGLNFYYCLFIFACFYGDSDRKRDRIFVFGHLELLEVMNALLIALKMISIYIQALD